MKKNNNNKKEMPVKVIAFWSSILVITLALVVAMCVKFVNSSKVITSMDEITHLTGRDIFKQGEKENDTYFVFYYSSDPSSESYKSSQELAKYLANYAEFARTYKGEASSCKLYLCDIANSENSKIVGDVSKIETTNYAIFTINDDSCPILVKYRVTKSGDNLSRDYVSKVVTKSGIIETLNYTMDSYNK